MCPANELGSVTIGQDAVQILKEQRRKTNSEYVFPSPTGGPISPDSVLNMLHRVLKRAGLPKIRFHDMRHTFATVALQNGVDVKTVSGMLGHYSAGFTLDTYTHVTTQAQRQAANTMANILSGAVENYKGGPIEAQRSGFDGERTNSEMSEFSG